MKTGTNAALSAASANSAADEVRDLEGDRERRRRRRWCRSSSRRRPRGPGPAIRLRPVAIEKIAVLRDDARGAGGRPRRPAWGRAGRAPLRSRLALRRRYRTRAGRGAGTRPLVRRRSWPTSIPRRSASSAPSVSAWRTVATRRRSRPTSAASRRAVEPRRRRGRRRRAPRADLDDRQGRQARRAAPQHRRPQEVPRRARARRLPRPERRPAPAASRAPRPSSAAHRRRGAVRRSRYRGQAAHAAIASIARIAARVLGEVGQAAAGQLEVGERRRSPARSASASVPRASLIRRSAAHGLIRSVALDLRRRARRPPGGRRSRGPRAGAGPSSGIRRGSASPCARSSR